jgi:predicted DNA-binding transcriptional regulator AlpA
METSRTALLAENSADERYINREQLRILVPVSDMTIWRWTVDPEIAFPQPVKLVAGGRNFWWLPAVREFLQRRERGEPRKRRAARSIYCVIFICIFVSAPLFSSGRASATSCISNRPLRSSGASKPTVERDPLRLSLGRTSGTLRNHLGTPNPSWYYRQSLVGGPASHRQPCGEELSHFASRLPLNRERSSSRRASRPCGPTSKEDSDSLHAITAATQ